MYYTKGKIIDISEDQFKNRETGELGEKNFYVEVLGKTKNHNGFMESELIKLKIKSEKVNEYKSKIGKEEEFQFSIYSKSQTFLTVI